MLSMFNITKEIAINSVPLNLLTCIKLEQVLMFYHLKIRHCVNTVHM